MRSSKGSAIIFIIILLVVVILGIGGFYIYMKKAGGSLPLLGKSSPPPVANDRPLFEQPVQQQSLEQELDSVDAEGTGAQAEFDALDRDLQSL